MFNYTAQVTHGSPGEHQWLLLLIMHKIKHAQPYQQSCAPPPPLPPLIPPSPRLPCFMELLFVTERCDVPGLSVPDGSTRKVRTICYITKYRYKFTKKIIFSLDLILSFPVFITNKKKKNVLQLKKCSQGKTKKRKTTQKCNDKRSRISVREVSRVRSRHLKGNHVAGGSSVCALESSVFVHALNLTPHTHTNKNKQKHT